MPCLLCFITSHVFTCITETIVLLSKISDKGQAVLSSSRLFSCDIVYKEDKVVFADLFEIVILRKPGYMIKDRQYTVKPVLSDHPFR